MNKEKVRAILVPAFILVLFLVVFNPSQIAYETVENNYLLSVKHDAEVLQNKKVTATEEKVLLSYGRSVCDVLNTEGKTGNDAVEYLANKSFAESNSMNENLDFIDIVISNAVRHLCPAHIALLD